MATTIAIQPMLAEVSDKIPTIGGLWMMGLVVAGLIVVAFRFSRHTLLLSLPLAGLWFAGMTREFCGDAYFKTAVIAEMGRAYLHQVVFSAALPLIVAVVCAVCLLGSLRSFTAKLYHA